MYEAVPPLPHGMVLIKGKAREQLYLLLYRSVILNESLCVAMKHLY